MSADSTIPVPPELVNLQVRFTQYWALANIIAGIVYGISLTISWNCLQVLLSSAYAPRNTGLTTPRNMRRVLVGFVIIMSALGTANIVFSAGGVVRWVAPNPDPDRLLGLLDGVWGMPFSLAELDMIVLTTWLSDGFMVWRCFKLYSDGISKGIRVCVYVTLTVISLTSLAFGFCALATPAPAVQSWSRYQILTVFEMICLGVNIILSSLVVLRIIAYQRSIKGQFGEYFQSPYIRIVTICIESASLTLVVTVAEVVLACTGGRYNVANTPGNMIAVKLLAHVNCISPVMIILRVAQGREWNKSYDSSGQSSIAFYEPSDSSKFVGSAHIVRYVSSSTLRVSSG